MLEEKIPQNPPMFTKLYTLTIPTNYHALFNLLPELCGLCQNTNKRHLFHSGGVEEKKNTAFTETQDLFLTLDHQTPPPSFFYPFFGLQYEAVVKVEEVGRGWGRNGAECGGVGGKKYFVHGMDLRR
jgi:hypothetical protein